MYFVFLPLPLDFYKVEHDLPSRFLPLDFYKVEHDLSSSLAIDFYKVEHDLSSSFLPSTFMKLNMICLQAFATRLLQSRKRFVLCMIKIF